MITDFSRTAINELNYWNIDYTVNEKFNYIVFDSDYIRNNQENIIEHCAISVDRIKLSASSMKSVKYEQITGQDMTWWYGMYNIFNISVGSEHFATMYGIITKCANMYFNLLKKDTPRQLWMQSWINYHNSSEVLKTHDHRFPVHGYISIDPQDTETVFVKDGKELYIVDNKPGRIYIGLGKMPHYVRNRNAYLGKRITLGFDFVMDPHKLANLGFVPILLKD
jgi:hypothetical protein